jgi:hypothetical protein
MMQDPIWISQGNAVSDAEAAGAATAMTSEIGMTTVERIILSMRIMV